jgi:hypothetical protein
MKDFTDALNQFSHRIKRRYVKWHSKTKKQPTTSSPNAVVGDPIKKRCLLYKVKRKPFGFKIYL